jgi:hypothetical protein
MNCRRVKPRLSSYLEGLLSPRDAAAVAAHLDGCPACRRLRDVFTSIGADLRAFPEPRQPLPIERRIAERWTAERAAPVSRRYLGSLAPPRAISRAAPALLAAGVLALLLGLAGPRGWEPSRTSESGGSRTPRQAARVQATPAPNAAAHREGPASKSRIAWSLAQRPAAADRSGAEGRPSPAASSPRSRPYLLAVPSGSRGQNSVVDDLVTVNGEAGTFGRRWASFLRAEWDRLEAQLRHEVLVEDDFVQVPFPRLADATGRQIAAAVESYQREAAVVDPRLIREVNLQQKASALSDLCERLRADTGIQLTAGSSVADEKVTLFCEKQPLRDVMRQLSRPFGYTWLRSGKTGEYKYELVQDLRSQLLEEELRNRDRNAALLAVEREMQRYRPYLDLSPEETLARAKTAPPEEKKLLERLAGQGWGPVQMYFRLSPRELAALRSGQHLLFTTGPRPALIVQHAGIWSDEPDLGEPQLPPDVARGVLQRWRQERLARRDDSYARTDATDPNGLPLTAVPEARATVSLHLTQSELGQFTIDGNSGFFIPSSLRPTGVQMMSSRSDGPYAVGISPSVLRPDNSSANARLARDPAMRARISLQPQPSCLGDLSPSPSPKRGGVTSPRYGMPRPAHPEHHQGGAAEENLPLPASGRGPGGEVNPPKVTSADALEALHRAAGMPIVADFYTRLTRPETVSVKGRPLFDALNQVADTMRLRWSKEGSWLQFRSASYYHDRLKEVPNRLLFRWAAARRQHGVLRLDQLVEMVQLSDAQLDAAEMAEGVRDCFGLIEWDVARKGFTRPSLRFVAQLTPAQRQEAQNITGLDFTRLSLAQQQQFIATRGAQYNPVQSLEELAGAALCVAYTQPGGYRWAPPVRPGRPERGPAELSLVWERTREAALQAARRLNPQVEMAEIEPTELALTFLYTSDNPKAGTHSGFVLRATRDGSQGW